MCLFKEEFSAPSWSEVLRQLSIKKEFELPSQKSSLLEHLYGSTHKVLKLCPTLSTRPSLPVTQEQESPPTTALHSSQNNKKKKTSTMDTIDQFILQTTSPSKSPQISDPLTLSLATMVPALYFYIKYLQNSFLDRRAPDDDERHHTADEHQIHAIHRSSNHLREFVPAICILVLWMNAFWRNVGHGLPDDLGILGFMWPVLGKVNWGWWV